MANIKEALQLEVTCNTLPRIKTNTVDESQEFTVHRRPKSKLNPTILPKKSAQLSFDEQITVMANSNRELHQDPRLSALLRKRVLAVHDAIITNVNHFGLDATSLSRRQ